MWFRSVRSISTMSLRYSSSRAEPVRTPIPSAGAVTHAASSRLLPATSTRQSRQAPGRDRPSSWHSVGMGMPASRATSRIFSPSRALTSLPLMLKVMTAIRPSPVGRFLLAGAVRLHQRQRLQRPADVGLPQPAGVLLAEVAQRAERRVGGGLPQPAQAGVLDHVAELLEQLQVRGGGPAVEDLVQQAVHLHG